MKIAPTFEIKVAVMGPVSAGKSTLINALLVGKYSEVSIRRTTAGVNFFRLTPPEESDDGIPSETKWSMAPDKVDSEGVVLKEISKDNKKLRDLKKVGEKTFDIEGIQLCECRKDTKLVVVDIPGINEADSSSKYRDYVANKWDQFDCVILVMDARHGVNTEEQIVLLEFIKSNLAVKKDLPVIMLFNKVDELDIHEEKELIEEARAKIASLFNIPGSIDIAQDIIDAKNQEGTNKKKNIAENGTYMPIFLPISARNGYVYRLAPVVDESRFMELEKELVEALGKEQIGLRQWNKLNNNEQYKAAYEAISDPDVYCEGIRSSNFETFLSVLSHCVAGSKTQTGMIERQVQVALESAASESGLATKIDILYDRMSGIGFSPEPLKDAFWEKFDELENKCQATSRIFFEPHLRVVPLCELVLYHQLTAKAQWFDEQERTIQKSKIFVNRFVANALKYRERAKGMHGRVFEIGQMLVMASNQHFLEHFGVLKIILEVEYHRAVSTTRKGVTYCSLCNKDVGDGMEFHLMHYGKCCSDTGRHCCPSCNTHLVPNQLRPGEFTCSSCNYVLNPAPTANRQESLCQFELEGADWKAVNHEESCDLSIFDCKPCDPRHFGHVFWIFCQWMETLKEEAASTKDDGDR
jgi:small GTP-binding protein